MKKLKQINLVLLVVSHLILFAYPLASKTFHVHEVQPEQSCCESCSTPGPVIDHPAQDCLICDYELLSFVSEPTFTPSVYWVTYPILLAPLPEKVHTEPIRHFSLRGPPVA
ncbi:hypothetical protein [Mangrovibacterium lignilyticum]|uniref:hypothetical protein n=1 Tax=Mangrovibacterium lignilyticum TaxID=2668052 RepID=UPI0013D1F749|nr:hypothetical protein [Mangrovibacterium lignilyticum]